MLKDINGMEVVNGDYMTWDNEDIAYFYKIEDGKPKVFANWMIGSLGLIDCENEDALNKDIHELEKVNNLMKYHLELILTNESGHITLNGDLENPYICNCDEDECEC